MTASRTWQSASTLGPLAHVDPRLKLAWLGWVSALSMLLDAPQALLCLFLLSAAVASGLRLSRKAFWTWVFLLALVTWGTVFSQAIFYARAPRTVWWMLVPPFEWGDKTPAGVPVYREGVVYGLTQSLRLLSVTLAGLSVALSTSPDMLLATLARLRVPSSVAVLTLSAMRFLPLLLRESADVRQALWLRGMGRSAATRSGGRPGSLNLFSRMRLEFALLLPVLASAVRRADALAASISSRGFDPLARRTSYPALRFRPLERVALVLLAVSLIVLVTIKCLYWLYRAELHYDSRLRPLYDFVREWL